MAGCVGFANSPARAVSLGGDKSRQRGNMKGVGESEGKKLLCAPRGEESPRLSHLENAGVRRETQGPLLLRGVFDMNTVILKLD